jgi:hypothetical protein
MTSLIDVFIFSHTMCYLSYFTVIIIDGQVSKDQRPEVFQMGDAPAKKVWPTPTNEHPGGTQKENWNEFGSIPC